MTVTNPHHGYLDLKILWPLAKAGNNLFHRGLKVLFLYQKTWDSPLSSHDHRDQLLFAVANPQALFT